MTHRPLWLLFLFLFIFVHHPGDIQSAEITINSDEQFRFAEQTLQKGEYQRAVTEFERFIHFFPEDEKAPKARYLIGLCYLKAKDYEQARKVYAELMRIYADKPIAGEALFMIGESYYRQGLFEEAERYFQQVMDRYPQPELKNRAVYRMGWSRMQTNKWREASENFRAVEPGNRLYPSSRDLSEKSLKGEALPYKDPTTAGVMAAVVPGLGHAYCERYKDGMVAFLLNGLFIWAAYESFDGGHEVLGAILTFVELGWYSGNIYSAVNSAHKYNRAAKNDFLRTLPDEVDVSLFTTRQGHLGLAFQIHF